MNDPIWHGEKTGRAMPAPWWLHGADAYGRHQGIDYDEVYDELVELMDGQVTVPDLEGEASSERVSLSEYLHQHGMHITYRP